MKNILTTSKIRAIFYLRKGKVNSHSIYGDNKRHAVYSSIVFELPSGV